VIAAVSVVVDVVVVDIVVVGFVVVVDVDVVKNFMGSLKSNGASGKINKFITLYNMINM